MDLPRPTPVVLISVPHKLLLHQLAAKLTTTGSRSSSKEPSFSSIFRHFHAMSVPLHFARACVLWFHSWLFVLLALLLLLCDRH